MKKRFNYRFFCFSALTVVCAVIPCILNLSLPVVIIISALSCLLAILSMLVVRKKRTRLTLAVLLIIFSVLTPLNYLRILHPRYNDELYGAKLRFYVTDVSVDKATVSGRFVDLESGVSYDKASFESEYYIDGHEFYPSDVVDMVGDVKTVTFFEADGDFSYEFLSGLRYRVTNVELYGLNRGAFALSVPEIVRAYMLDRVNETFEGDVRGVVAALLFGDKTMISHSVKDAMSASGLSHVLAISGLHFSVISGIVGYFINKTKAYPRTKVVLTTLVMLFYASICDFSPSVTRAFLMMAVSGLATFTARRYDVMSSICFACTVSLILSPEQLVNLSFLMSYTAVLGIIFLQRPLKKLLNALPNKLSDFLSTSLSANFGILPVVCQAFEQFSIIFLLSNALVLPLMSVLYVLLLLTLIPGVLGIGVGAIAGLMVEYLIAVGDWTANFQSAVVNVTGPGILLIIAYYLVVIYSSEYIFKKKSKNSIANHLENAD